MRSSRSPIVLLLLVAGLVPPAEAQTTLFSQSVAAVLRGSAVARRTPALEFLVLDLRTGEPLASTFADLHAPMPVGSLLKPFLLVALPADTAPFVVHCRGAVDRCWRRGGHGTLRYPEDLAEALAQSCNAFFLTLAASLRPADLDGGYGLPTPPSGAPAKTLIGLTGDWPVAPLTIAEAYRNLLAEVSQSPASARLAAVRRGMLEAAAHGTARGVGSHPGGVLAKTGTAPCLDLTSRVPPNAEPGSVARARVPVASGQARGKGGPCVASGDGLVVAAVPASRPKLLLLVRQRGTTGAHAALAAGALLRELEAVRGL